MKAILTQNGLHKALLGEDQKATTMVETIKEAIWLKSLFGELSLDLQVTTVHCNNQSAIHLTKD
jgi:hypothetical protein